MPDHSDGAAISVRLRGAPALQVPLGTVHKADRDRRSWSENLAAERAALGVDAQPYCLVIGGGQARNHDGCASEAIGRADDHRGEKRERGQFLAKPLPLALSSMIPIWYDHLPYLPFPDNWPVFTPKDKWAIGSSPTSRSWSSTTGAQLKLRARASTPTGNAGRSMSSGRGVR